MPYPFRYEFMANAVDEATAMSNDREAIKRLDSRLITTYWMRSSWTIKQRNDWFHMYVMGGQPFPQRSLQEDETNRQWYVNKRAKELKWTHKSN